MSTIVKGMTMPDMCAECDFLGGLIIPDGIYVCDCPVDVIHGRNVTEKIENDCRHPDCPLDAFQDESSHSLIFGYPLEYLVAFAEACRRAGVDEDDLKTFANNCTFAYATMGEEYRRLVNQAMDAMMGNLGRNNDE